MNLLRASENRFVAVNDDGTTAGVATISRLNLERIFEDRPIQYEINVKSDEEAKVLLLSAAATRARFLWEQDGKTSRVYAVLDPEDKTALEAVRMMGFKRYDGIVRMRKPINVKGVDTRLQPGFTRINDRLGNPEELRKCVRRYNDCFGHDVKPKSFMEIINKPDFVRMMVVNDRGLCGELLAWTQGNTGVIGVIQTAREYRRMGIASALVESARKYFEELGMDFMSFDMWRAAPGNRALAENAGFTEYKVLTLYPEMV